MVLTRNPGVKNSFIKDGEIIYYGVREDTE
jgi:hypothetical protein